MCEFCRHYYKVCVGGWGVGGAGACVRACVRACVCVYTCEFIVKTATSSFTQFLSSDAFSSSSLMLLFVHGDHKVC